MVTRKILAKPRRAVAALTMLMGLLCGALMVNAAGPALAADTSTKYFGVFRDGTPTQTAEGVSDAYGVTPASVMWFDSWASGLVFPVNEAKALWAKGIMPHYTWEPWNTSLGVGDAGQIHPQDIIDGKWDSYIKARGAEFAAVGSPLMVRFGHEFNGNWYPWGTANNNNDPTVFVKAYQHVHDLVVAAGATNVQWIWAFNNGSSPGEPWNDPSLAYPGSAYVDWVGIDGYNWGFGPSWDPTADHWSSFNTVVSSAYQAARTIAPNKPIMVSEYASTEDGGDKAAWIKDMDAQLQSGAYPDLKLLTYFDVNKEEPWYAASSAASLSAFISWVKEPYMNGTGAALSQIAAQYAAAG